MGKDCINDSILKKEDKFIEEDRKRALAEYKRRNAKNKTNKTSKPKKTGK